MTANSAPTHHRRLLEYYQKHEHVISILFFIGGFLFDMVMLERIDSPMTIGQQGLYLALILAGLLQIFFEQTRPQPDLSRMFVLKRWFYEYRMALMHFFFGTLLNGYTLFFFKSSSLIVSFLFMIFMAALLVVNESHRFKSSELSFKFGLLTLCLLCYFSYVTPVAVGSISLWVFLLSSVAGCLPVVGAGWWIQTYRPTLFEQAKRQILMPMILVLAGFLGLYFVKLIPPVPLSLQFIGVYHSVERVPGGFRVSHERAWWRFWQNGDQEFRAQNSDKIFVFFRLFSPARFSDQVLMRWYWKDNRQGWVLQDSIPIKIIGGRSEGFRGYGFKTHYQPGNWKVQIETMDEREIGRVYFDLEIVPEGPRSFQDVVI